MMKLLRMSMLNVRVALDEKKQGSGDERLGTIVSILGLVSGRECTTGQKVAVLVFGVNNIAICMVHGFGTTIKL